MAFWRAGWGGPGKRECFEPETEHWNASRTVSQGRGHGALLSPKDGSSAVIRGRTDGLEHGGGGLATVTHHAPSSTTADCLHKLQMSCKPVGFYPSAMTGECKLTFPKDSERPDLAEDVPAHSRGVGVEDL